MILYAKYQSVPSHRFHSISTLGGKLSHIFQMASVLGMIHLMNQIIARKKLFEPAGDNARVSAIFTVCFSNFPTVTTGSKTELASTPNGNTTPRVVLRVILIDSNETIVV